MIFIGAFFIVAFILLFHFWRKAKNPRMKTFMRIGKQSNHANKAIHWEQDLSFELQQWKHLYERGEITAEQYKKHTKDTIQKYESISNI